MHGIPAHISISDFSSSSSSYLIVAATLALVAGTALSVELSPPTSPQSAIASLGLPVVRTDLRDRGGQQQPRTVVLVWNLYFSLVLVCFTKYRLTHLHSKHLPAKQRGFRSTKG